MPSRSFDITVTKLKDDSQVTFAGIDKEEQKNLINYFKSKNVKIRILDVETNQHANYNDEDEDDEEDEESKGGKARRKVGAPAGAK